jgi:hypothetical protein
MTPHALPAVSEPDRPIDRCSVRVSEWESDAIRIVLDLKLPCDDTYEITSGPSARLVVRVQPRTPGEFVSD